MGAVLEQDGEGLLALGSGGVTEELGFREVLCGHT